MVNHTKSTPQAGSNPDTADLPPDVQLALWAKEAAELYVQLTPARQADVMMYIASLLKDKQGSASHD